MTIPKIRGTQVGLRNSSLVDQLKQAMAAGNYAYDEPRGQIGGLMDQGGAYHIVEGHHRMAAALELLQETGDKKAVRALLFWGRWSLCLQRPGDSRPLSGRSRWTAFRNWIGF
jgi:hypothetical protein